MTPCRQPYLDWPSGRSGDGHPQGVVWLGLGWASEYTIPNNSHFHTFRVTVQISSSPAANDINSTTILQEEINALQKEFSSVSDVFNEDALWTAAHPSSASHSDPEIELPLEDMPSSYLPLPRTSSPVGQDPQDRENEAAKARRNNRISVLSVEDLPPPPPMDELLVDQDLPLPPPPPPIPVTSPPNEQKPSLAGKLKTSQTDFLRERNPFIFSQVLLGEDDWTFCQDQTPTLINCGPG
jgi:hypothetical protein